MRPPSLRATTLAVALIAASPAVANALTWHDIGGSMNSNPLDMALDSFGNLYVGGGFITAGNTSANRIAKWNGSEWSALGPGLNGAVRAIATDATGIVYAGGDFTDVGGAAGTALQSVAKWDPRTSTWTALGSGLSGGGVSALAVDDSGNVYAGGTFTGSGGTPLSHLAKWDGSTWQPVGGGTSDWVFDLAIDTTGSLYVGGLFQTAGQTAAKRIARWNPSTMSWSAVGPGVNGTVWAVEPTPQGDVYVGGEFTQTDGGAVTLNGIGRWDGSSWTALGQGVSGTANTSVNAIASDASAVYVGGEFTSAGGSTAGEFAAWSFTSPAWSMFGPWTGTNYGEVRALARDPKGFIYAAGYMRESDERVTMIQRALVAQPPGAPTVLSPVGGDARATVSWLPPMNDGGGTVTSYTVTSSPGGFTCTAPSGSCTVTGLANGTPYTFTVAASNAAGAGPPSGASASVTPAIQSDGGGASPDTTTAPNGGTPAASGGGGGVSPGSAVASLRTRMIVKKGVVTTTGPLPPGATRVTQTARTRGAAVSQRPAEMARPKTATGTCRVKGRAFTCRIKLAKGQWTVTTRARGPKGVVAQGTRRVVAR